MFVVISESKGEITKSTIDVKIESEKANGESKLDFKLLMVPIIYTTKLEVMPVLANKTINSVQSKDVIEEILAQSKPENKKVIKVNNVEKVQTPTSINEESEIPNFLEEVTQEDESDEDEPISEDQKVKPSSYLLQKPRSRSYNPIQLCKNPDFNTRLKRLNVGFFTSTHNRRLLKACMPLTIDLHKTFETKLIEGTLYLKSGDVANASEQLETKEDSHSEQATVLPSAMPVQSLMDATVSSCLPTTRQIDNITSNTVDLTSKCDDDVLERNKVINLHDLSEIRRINQRLLTAEVPPIPIDSETHTSTVPLLQAPTEEHNAQYHNNKCIHQNEYNNAVPSSSSQSESFTPQSNDCRSTTNNNNVDNNLLVENDLTEVKRMGRSGWGRGRGRGGKAGPKSFTKYPAKVPLYTIQRPPSVPWNKPKTNLTYKSDDCLITIDTLNKMINKMNGSDLYVDPTKKNKKPIWVVESKKVDSVVEDKEEAKKDSQVEEEPRSAPEIESKLQKDPTPPRDVQIENTSVVEKKPCEKRPPRPKTKMDYCCWCNEKLYKLETKARVRQKHMCFITCECCCRFQLAEALYARGKRKHKLLVNDSIVLSDEEDLSNKSISAPIPLIRVVETTPKKKVTTKSTQVGDSDSLSGKQGEINAAVDSILSTKTSANTNSNLSNGRGLRLTVGAVTSSEGGTMCSVPVVTRIESTPEIFTQNTAVHIPEIVPQSQSPPIAIKKKVTIWPNNRKPPVVLKRPLVRIKPKEISTRYTVVSNPKSLHEIHVKKDERVLFLNSKNIADRQNQCPIFLGENKILLSTVKMPRETDSAKVPIPPLIPTQAVVPTLPLPLGVQLVLMPTGELTYTVEPGVTLTKAELSVIPNIMSVVQKQIAHQIQPLPSIPTSQDVQSTAMPVDNTSLVQDQAPENQAIIGNNQLGLQNCSVSNSEITINDSESQTSKVTTVVDKSSNEQMINLGGLSEKQKETDTALILNDGTEEVMDTREPDKSTLETVKDSSSENNIKESQRTIETTEPVPSVSNCRNLLSDLMEMSGISAADILPAPQDLELEPTIVFSSNVNSKQIPETVTTNAESEVIDVDTIQTQLEVPLPVTPSSAVTLPELTPISSIAELKYACDHNAQFFKLDLDTGIVVSINVAIKRNIKTKAAPITKSIIDLTDDPDDESAITVCNIQNSDDLSYKISSDVLSKISDVSTGVKPLKLFKAVRKVKGSSNLTLQQKVTPSTLPSSTGRRKRRFDKIETNINLIDSDTPMEEEYLINNTDDEDTTSPKPTRKALNSVTPIIHIEEEDSSDDEPLAVISKRMKEAEKCNNATKERAVEKPPQKENLINPIKEVSTKNQVEIVTDSTPDESNKATGSQDEVAIEDSDEKMDTEEDTFLEEVEDNDSQDDCILGV